MDLATVSCVNVNRDLKGQCQEIVDPFVHGQNLLPGPFMNRLKRFRNTFGFFKKVRSQSSKFRVHVRVVIDFLL